jgi:hypothetical protein
MPRVRLVLLASDPGATARFRRELFSAGPGLCHGLFSAGPGFRRGLFSAGPGHLAAQ